MPKELDHPRKSLINIQNIKGNECFKWCLVRYLHSADHNPKRSRKGGNLYGSKLDFKDIKIPSKVRDILSKLKEKVPFTLMFLVTKIRKISNLCIKKCFEDKNVNLLLIREGEIRAPCSYQRF